MIELEFDSFEQYQQNYQKQYEAWKKLCEKLNSPNPDFTMMPDPRERKIMPPDTTVLSWVSHEAWRAYNSGYRAHEEEAKEEEAQDRMEARLRAFLEAEGISVCDVPELLGYDDNY